MNIDREAKKLKYRNVADWRNVTSIIDKLQLREVVMLFFLTRLKRFTQAEFRKATIKRGFSTSINLLPFYHKCHSLIGYDPLYSVVVVSAS